MNELLEAFRAEQLRHRRENRHPIVEMRMTSETRERLIAEVGEITGEDWPVVEGAEIRMFGILVVDDDTLRPGEMRAWPTADEKAATEAIASWRNRARR